MKRFFQILIVGITCYFAGCIEPYDPPEIGDFDDLLVIDANVNGTVGEANVILSRGQALDDDSPVEYVSGAVVELEMEDGTVFQLQANGNGKYYINGLGLSFGDRVRLHIIDADGTEYLSDYEEYVKTPEIDSVSYDSNKEGVNFYVSTHDPNNNTFYYKWDFTETWKFRSAFPSSYIWERIDTSIIVKPREMIDTLYYCYKYDSSTQIIIGNSKRLSEDRISEYRIAKIDNSTGKFGERYSMLVKQRALTEESYKYWELLKSNTESIGSLFDPQPSQLNSNIINITNPEIGVLGYFNVYSETQQRISLVFSDVEPHFYNNGYGNCVFDTIYVEDLYDDLFGQLLISDLTEGISPYAYLYSFPSCMDCRLRGTNKVPEFWQ